MKIYEAHVKGGIEIEAVGECALVARPKRKAALSHSEEIVGNNLQKSAKPNVKHCPLKYLTK
ncbi:hypothetical protein DRJ04_02305 [Candidatus Aerophobetes bacterium]|uniref:Uncharacterized protein n=1 Tax=Aerophobetes bacterium TaxID=2030807 RepID=A0A662DKT4_UNCAE|nr:MAG: hypothetical protein DRJ04_02305 [Candidatus Aerophobetes bacterium]